MLIIRIVLTKNEHKSYIQDRHALTSPLVCIIPYTLECPDRVVVCLYDWTAAVQASFTL